jgi:uncharacterized protein (TIGR02217 family)
MTITVYQDLILPEGVISAGIRGKNMRSNTRVMSGNGYASVNINWARTLRQYELGITPMSVENWLEIEALHEATDSGAYGFLMQDPKDKSADHTTGKLQGWLSGALVGTSGNGFGVPSYRLNKRYSTINATRTYDRRITRPKSTIEVRRNGNLVSVGGGASQISLDYTTGSVTFVRDATQMVSSFIVGATTTVRFANTTFSSQLASGGRLYLSGVSGTAATVLNDKSHEIVSVSGTDVVINTSTSGLTASSGNGFKYPQPADTLTWSGEFYVPVHFANDEIDWEIVLGGPYTNRLVAGPSVVVQEVREP